MPYDSNGNYSLPPGYKVGTGDTVLPTQHNPPLEDIAGALSSAILRSGVAPMEGDLPFGGNRAVDLGAGVLSSDAATVGQLANSMPIGVTVDFAGSAAPSGWLMCFGQEVSRADYAALFTVIGVAYGTGNGSTTFNLPDLRGRVIAGKDNMGGTAAERITTDGSGIDGKVLGAAGGSQAQTLTIEQMPEHDHGGKVSNDGKHTHGFTVRGQQYSDQAGSRPTLGGAGLNLQWVSTTDEAGEHDHTVSKQGGAKSHSSMQPSIVMNKIIRAIAA